MVPEVGFELKIFTWFVKRLNDIQNSWLFFIYTFKQFISSSLLEVGLSWLIIGQMMAIMLASDCVAKNLAVCGG